MKSEYAVQRAQKIMSMIPIGILYSHALASTADWISQWLICKAFETTLGPLRLGFSSQYCGHSACLGTDSAKARVSVLTVRVAEMTCWGKEGREDWIYQQNAGSSNGAGTRNKVGSWGPMKMTDKYGHTYSEEFGTLSYCVIFLMCRCRPWTVSGLWLIWLHTISYLNNERVYCL